MNARVEPVEAADDEGRGWAERNQRWLAERLGQLRNRVHARLGRNAKAENTEAEVEPVTPAGTGAAAPADGFVPALTRIERAFGLTRFERELLLLAAGVELDEALRALLPGGPTFTQALAVLSEPHWDAIAPQRPLRH